MFAVITLENTLDLLTIPMKWIKGIDLMNFVNDGINCSEPHVVFLSMDINMPPDFSMPISPSFESIESGCFWARINKFFGTYMPIISF